MCLDPYVCTHLQPKPGQQRQKVMVGTSYLAREGTKGQMTRDKTPIANKKRELQAT